MATYRVRHDGWTPQRQRAFLRALSETGSVRDACARAQISTTSAYRMRDRSVAFDRAWRRALAKVAPTIEQAAYERAVLGWEEPVWHGGKIVGHRRRYSDSLLRLLVTRGIGDGRRDDGEPVIAHYGDTGGNRRHVDCQHQGSETSDGGRSRTESLACARLCRHQRRGTAGEWRCR